MSLLISVNQLKKTMGSKLLFDGLSFGVSQGEKLGLLGPNGAGKSTLLKIMTGNETPDEGDVSARKGLKMAYVAQREDFSDERTLWEEATAALVEEGQEETEAQVQSAIHLSKVGFEDIEVLCGTLSGGWKKRLSLAIAFSKEPELLILDEPTNHMDWDGILWLENFLKSYKQAFVLVSHDREFLDALCTRTMEIHRLYKKGSLSFDCGYRKFIEKKEEYIQAQLQLQQSMSNKARREVDWLRAGVKARTTKSQSRIKEAHKLLDDLQEVKNRNRAAQAKVRVEIDAHGRRSKKLIEMKKVSIAYGENSLIKNLDLVLGPKTCFGVLGENGSGKSSLLKVLAQTSDHYEGQVFWADGLKIVYFDQKREDLPQDIDLVEYLGDGSDYTVFKGQSTHVAAYASRFLFSSEKMKLKISQLSGGEQARLLIAKILLQPADVLIMDEPTNDLDIDSIEILEESLSQFPGHVLLVSHDRYFLSSLCQSYLALHGGGRWNIYPDVQQWLRDRKKYNLEENSQNIEISNKKNPVVEQSHAEPQDSSGISDKNKMKVKKTSKKKNKKKIKLSYKEKQAAKTIEGDLQKAEDHLAQLESQLKKSEIFSDHEKSSEVIAGIEKAQKKVESLYIIYGELDEKGAFQ